MGVLDEAIKEHLELKRRHGADPGEVARLEHEALGPARREPAPPAGEVGAAEEDPEVVEDTAAAEPGEVDEPADPEAYDPTAADERVEALVEDEEPIYEEDLLGESEEPPPDEDPSPAAPAEQPTVAFDVTAPDGTGRPGSETAEGEEEGHDELEETPEFLQETPEHDRLWFEQKPPKDFDF